MRATPPPSSVPSPPPAGDVQARPPAIAVGLSRVGVTGVEKVVRIRDELFFARLECFVDLSHDQKGAHMSRFEEVVNEAIGEVVLTESPFRAETLARDIAELVRERQGAGARGGDGRGALPRAQAGSGVGDLDAGDLHAVRPRRRARARGRATWWGCRRLGSPRARAPRSWSRRERASACPSRRASRRRRSSASSRRCRSRPTTSAGWAPCTSAASRTATRRSTRRRCWGSWRARCPRRSTS